MPAAHETTFQEIARWRELYCGEMACQIVNDSLHTRPGWTREYALTLARQRAGYGSIAIGGPYASKPTLYEFYLAENHRLRAFDLFETLVSTSHAVAVEAQTNDAMLTVMLHACCRQVACEKILFSDKVTTNYRPEGLRFRQRMAEDSEEIARHQLGDEATWLVEIDGLIVATGGIVYRNNRPYADIFMAVAEPFRHRGIGTFIVQELKRICYLGGSIPGASCRTANIASRKTLQKAGFVPCATLLTGQLAPENTSPP